MPRASNLAAIRAVWARIGLRMPGSGLDAKAVIVPQDATMLDQAVIRMEFLRRGFNDPDRNPPDARNIAAGQMKLATLDGLQEDLRAIRERYWNQPDGENRQPKDDLGAQTQNREPAYAVAEQTASMRVRSPEKADRWATTTVVPESPQTQAQERLEDEGMDRLIEGRSDASRSKNIATEIRAGKPPKQAEAIAYSVQREARDGMATFGALVAAWKRFKD